jgi:hypothetical protein
MGATVPQNGQTSACLAGFHCASAPQEGQLNLDLAMISDMEEMTNDEWRMTITAAEIHRETGAFDVLRQVDGAVQPDTDDDED